MQSAKDDIKNDPVWTFKKPLAQFISTISVKIETAEKTKDGKATMK
jgi:hypothetical protein